MKNKLTIGLFMDSFFPMIEGVTIVVDNYARKLMKYANVIVFVPEVPGKKFDDSKLPYKVVRCRAIRMPVTDYSMPIPLLSRHFIKELNSYNLDIVHIHSPFMVGKIGIRYAKKNKVPVIATMHTQFKLEFQRIFKLEQLSKTLNHTLINVFDSCDECWAVNSEVARIFYKDYKCKKMPRIMNNATNMEPVDDIEEAKTYINTKYNLNSDDKVFLFVGRIDTLKNILFIVDSLKILKNLNPKFNFKMLFVGSGRDEHILEKHIKDTNMENEIILCGRISDRKLLAKYYARADLFLFPSLYDASSLVQIEAASQKTPTLFLEGAATADTIKNNVNGFLSKNNEKEYAQSILDIMNNTNLYNKVCENAFNEVYVSWDKKIAEVFDLYKDFYNKNLLKQKN